MSQDVSQTGANPQKISFLEFVGLLALTMSLVALAIDAMLPALPNIVRDFGVEQPNASQFVITALFVGLSFGQLLAGPLSDSFGRKKAIYVGLILFVIGCLLSYFSQSYEMMLVGRFVQGLGAACPRVITIAIVRDRYEGRDMARVMSYIMGIFIFVPALAPTIGQAIMAFSDWRGVFLVFIAIAVVVFLWLSTRLEESIHPDDIRPFTLPVIWQGVMAVCSNKMTVCYTIAAGCVFGAFIGYLNSAEQIFHDYYDVGDHFPLYFCASALALGAAFFVNAGIVKKYGMRKVILWALVALALVSMMFGTVEWATASYVPLPAFMIFIVSSTFCMGMLFGNCNTLAMIPMGHMAGIASAVIGAASLVVSVIAGGLIGQLYDGDLIPVTGGFLSLSLISLLVMYIAERGHKPGAVS